jgi:hypothetical protein
MACFTLTKVTGSVAAPDKNNVFDIRIRQNSEYAFILRSLLILDVRYFVFIWGSLFWTGFLCLKYKNPPWNLQIKKHVSSCEPKDFIYIYVWYGSLTKYKHITKFQKIKWRQNSRWPPKLVFNLVSTNVHLLQNAFLLWLSLNVTCYVVFMVLWKILGFENKMSACIASSPHVNILSKYRKPHL